MVRMTLLCLFSAATFVCAFGEVEVAWATDSKFVGEDSAALNMVCFPAASSCKDATAAWAVHSVIKVDKAVSERTTVNTEAYPSDGVPSAFQLGSCNTSSGEVDSVYKPARETFSQTYVQTKQTGIYTEIGGSAFSSQTKLIRRADITIDGVQGLFGTHDNYALADNWDLAERKTPWDIPYGQSEKLFQQFYLFPKAVTLGPIAIAPCDMLHLFYFVRDGSARITTSADWKFRQEPTRASLGYVDRGFSQRDFLGCPPWIPDAHWTKQSGCWGGHVALRQVDAETIGVEVEKGHFLKLTQKTSAQVSLPTFTSAAGVEYYRMYEWKAKVYCTSDLNVGALPNLTEVTGAQFRAGFATTLDPDEAVARNLTDIGEIGGAGGRDGWQISNDWGSWVQNMTFYHIPSDGQPLTYKDPQGQDHIHLNLFWENLPDVASCPVIVWDPTFHALPAAGSSPADITSETKLEYQLKVAFTASGSVSDYSSARLRLAILKILAQLAGLIPQDGNDNAPPGSALSVNAASVHLVATLPVASSAAADAAAGKFNGAITDADALGAKFREAGLEITVETMPLVTAGKPTSGGDRGVDLGLIIGASVGGAVAAIAIVVATIRLRKTSKKAGKANARKDTTQSV